MDDDHPRLLLDYGLQLDSDPISSVKLENQLDFSRLDETDDGLFYSSPRFVQHLSLGHLEKLTALYSQLLQAGSRVLDLCSSWDCHLPPHVCAKAAGGCLVGHGMNEAELLANPRLHSFFVQDLNVHAALPCQTAGFDAVVCCAGLQYLVKPLDVLQEVRRVLVPGGVLVVAFSSHCFPTKAAAYWLGASMQTRVQLVQRLMTSAGFVDVTAHTTVALADTPGGASTGETQLGEGEAEPYHEDFVAVVGRAPVAVAPADEALSHYDSLAASRLAGVATSEEGEVSTETMRQWVRAYWQMAEEAKAMGIPSSALPPLSAQPSVEQLREARKLLSAIIASFVSSGL